MDIISIVIVFTGLSFIAYGINSFISKRMISEFKRWGLEKSRKLIGFCQFITGLGLLIGLQINLILVISSIFLIIMMLCAVYIRIRIKDNISDILPAIAYLLLGLLIYYYNY